MVAAALFTHLRRHALIAARSSPAQWQLTAAVMALTAPCRFMALSKAASPPAILAFFLGGLGVHKFYCGKIGLGFLYLIFFWTWIPALVALVEGVVFLTNANTDEEFIRKYCI